MMVRFHRLNENIHDCRDSIDSADSYLNDNNSEMSVMESESIVTRKKWSSYDATEITNFMCDDVLMRRCMMTNDSSSLNKVSQILKQIVLPPEYRPHVLSLVHDVKTAGHLGRTKTTFKLLQSFCLPGVYSDISKYVTSCHNCQISGKAGQHPAKSPLIPIPVMSEPFQKIQIDCVGPSNPTSKGNMYLWTIMCTATRYPEAYPLRNNNSFNAELLGTLASPPLNEEAGGGGG